MTKRLTYWLVAAVFIIVAALVMLALFKTIAVVVMILMGLFCAVSASIEFSLRGYTSRSGEKLDAIRFPPSTQGTKDLTKISALIPLYDEAEVIGQTIAMLARQNYPKENYEVHLSLQEGDDATILEVQYAISGLPNFHLHINKYGKDPNKPKQLNKVLPHASGDLIAVFDAEDLVRPNLFRSVDALYKKSGANMVQGGVQLMNPDIETTKEGLAATWDYICHGWFAIHNVMEYWFWFSSRMFFQQEMGFVPLGGNTIFIEQSLLRRAGGWDETKLTEDADLGTRLCTEYGATLVAAYSPELATHEQTPSSVMRLAKQRVRWDQGFWQVLRDRRWLKLPTLRQRVIAGYTLATPLIQAVSGLFLPFALLGAIMLKLPLPLTMALYIPVAILLLTMFTQMIELRSFSRAFAVKVHVRHYLSLLIGYFPYQFLLGASAVAAVIREALHIYTWSHTDHRMTKSAEQSALAPSLSEPAL